MSFSGLSCRSVDTESCVEIKQSSCSDSCPFVVERNRLSFENGLFALGRQRGVPVFPHRLVAEALDQLRYLFG